MTEVLKSGPKNSLWLNLLLQVNSDKGGLYKLLHHGVYTFFSHKTNDVV